MTWRWLDTGGPEWSQPRLGQHVGLPAGSAIRDLAADALNGNIVIPDCSLYKPLG
jgi:hypothetical protein